MASLGDVQYEISAAPVGKLLRRLPSGELSVLGVRGRPDFTSCEAMSGVLYRAEWLPHAAATRAARFYGIEELRASGNCLHLACRDKDARQWWCYRTRERDDGTLSLLAEPSPQCERPRRRRLKIARFV